MYRALTQNIEIRANPKFLPEPSKQHRAYIFAYEIELINHGSEHVQLLSRHWIIRDGNGQSHEVTGDGVIGEQPVIAPGTSYRYSSYCPLPTRTGNMRGTYRMQREDGSSFDAEIPLFFLRDDDFKSDYDHVSAPTTH